MIPVECPNCKSQLKAPDEAAGRTAKCKKCGSPITIPRVAASNVDKPNPNAMIPSRQLEIKTSAPPPIVRGVLEPKKTLVPTNPTTNCAFCGEEVLASAKKCKHCGEILDVALRAADEAKRFAEQSNRGQQFIPAAASSSSSSTVVVINNHRFPHTMHLILSIVTCGFWLPVWLIHYMISPK